MRGRRTTKLSTPETAARRNSDSSSRPDHERIHELQTGAGNHAVLRSVLSGATLQSGDVEGEGPSPATGLAKTRAPLSGRRGRVHIQKFEKEGEAPPQPATAEPAGPASAPTEPSRATSEPEAPAASRFLVDDDALNVGPGQMRKSDFLARLKPSVCGAAEEALAGSFYSAMGCPWIEQWFEHYANQDAAHVERALRKYAPEARDAIIASDYVPIVTARVRRGIAEWMRTGEVKGLPEEVQVETPAAGLMGGAAGLLGGVVGAVGGALSAIGGLFFKRRDNHADHDGEVNPRAIQGQLGAGRPLDAEAKTRMEAAFGTNFSSVRVHTDATAAELNDQLGARAFTLGDNVAFGSGEYQPGTLVGDALIAHELAHVVQQGGATAEPATKQEGAGDEGVLEEQADSAAVGAVVRIWGGNLAEDSRFDSGKASRLRSGLRLQRCNKTPEKTPEKAPRPPDFEKKREAYLKEGLDKLYAGGCGFPGRAWRYDTEHWKKVRDEQYEAYEPIDLAPAAAIDNLFENLSLWDFDCAMYPEVAMLYAYRHALGDDGFNKEFANLRVRQHRSTGLETEWELHDVESEDAAAFNKLFDEAPVGSKVAWTNRSPVTLHTAWHHENAIKRFKGDKPEDDRYDAHPLGKNMSEEEVKRGLAENASDYPMSGTDAEKEAYIRANIYRHQVKILK